MDYMHLENIRIQKSVSADVSDLLRNAALSVRTGEIARRRF